MHLCVWGGGRGEGVDYIYIFFFSNIKNQMKINLFKYQTKVHIQSQYKIYAQYDTSNWASSFSHTCWILGLSADTGKAADRQYDPQHQENNKTKHNLH